MTRILLITLLSGIFNGYAQQPTRLTTDLIEHTDRVFLDGYPSTLALSELNTAVERYQAATIRNPKPVFGWVVNSDKENTLQTAYRILVASSPDLLAKDEADMWDSGRTESDNSVAVACEGKELKPSTAYYWKVKVWNSHNATVENESESTWSQVRAFLTADKLDGGTSRYPLQVTDEEPVNIIPIKDGRLIDFGRDAFGRLKLTVHSDKETDTLTVRLGETLKDGRIDRKPGGTIRYAEYRLPLVSGTNTYQVKIRPDRRNTDVSSSERRVIPPILMPDYTGEVLPFRYCEVEGLRDESLKAVRQTVHYPFDETAAQFYSSDTVLNRVWELCKYSVKATSFAGVYVDGDRERIPYEADAMINQLCHYVSDREFTIARYSHEYLIHHATWPTEWVLQSPLMAWYDYMYTGDSRSLRRFYDELKAKTLLSLKDQNGLISTKTGKLTPEVIRSIHFRGNEFRDIVDWPPSEMDGFEMSDYNAVVNAFHCRALCCMAEIAGAIGNQKDKEEYASLAVKMKKDFNRAFFDAKKGYYRDGIGVNHSSLHSNMFALALGLVPEKNVKTVFAFIRSRGMACSVYGSQFLGDAVYEANDAEYGLQLLSSTDLRSWYNMIRVGSTISLEAWDNKFKSNQDWNHIWGAAAGNIIARKLMGIEPIEPGYAKIRIKPQPATLHQASITLPSIRGDIKVSFDNHPGEHFSLDAEIPANATAEIWLPKISAKYVLTVDDVPQKGVPDGDFVKVTVGSGRHVFRIR